MATNKAVLEGQLKNAMQICSKMSCGVSQHPRDTYIVDQVRGSDAAINNNYKVQLDKATEYDAEGRILHMRGLVIECMLKLVATGTSDPVNLRDLYGVFQNLTLKNAAGHVYFTNIDARTLLDEMWVRFGQHTQDNLFELGSYKDNLTVAAALADPLTTSANASDLATAITLANELKVDINVAATLINQLRSTRYQSASIDGNQAARGMQPILETNKAAGDYYVHVSLVIDFVAPPQFGMSQLEGLIPVPFLSGNADALQLKVASVIPNVSGVTVGAIMTADRLGQPTPVSAVNTAPPNSTVGYDVKIDGEYLPGVVIDRFWEVETMSLPGVQGVFDKQDKVTQSLAIRYLDEEDLENANNHADFGVQVGAFHIMNGLTKEQALQRTISLHAQNKWGAWAQGRYDKDLPMTDVSGGARRALIVTLIPHRSYAYAARGKISYKFTRTTATHTRYLRRTVDCHKPEAAKAIALMIADKCGCGTNGTLFGTTENGSPCTQLNPEQPLVYVPKTQTNALGVRR